MNIQKFESFEYPKGWVNVKIDNDIMLRMSRYVPALDRLMSKLEKSAYKFDLHQKIEVLSQIDTYLNNEKITIQEKISVITLLQYLNEIVNNFNASSSGFLFEYYLATLIHGNINNKGNDAYGPVDISSADLSKSYTEIEPTRFSVASGSKKLTYQIKLYKKPNERKNFIPNIPGEKFKVNKSDIEINLMEGKMCDFYVICLKNGNSSIDIHILSGRDEDISTSYHITNKDLSVVERNTGKTIREVFDDNGVLIRKYVLINTSKLRNDNMNIVLPISNIDDKIERCGDNIKERIESLYNNLSDLHYDIDAMVSGVDRDKRKISITKAKAGADMTMKKLEKNITGFKITK